MVDKKALLLLNILLFENNYMVYKVNITFGERIFSYNYQLMAHLIEICFLEKTTQLDIHESNNIVKIHRDSNLYKLYLSQAKKLEYDEFFCSKQ